MDRKEFGMRSVNISPIRAVLHETGDTTTDFIICSSEQLMDGSTLPNVLWLQFADTEDAEHPLAFNKEEAEKVVDFFRREGHNEEVFVCCDAGESRGAAIAAALLLSDGQSDEGIWRSAEYHPNPLVFGIMCRALGVEMTEIDIVQRKFVNDRALQMAIVQKRLTITGELISILGDSISTYEGYNPEDYAVFYTGEQREKSGLRSVEDTWWFQVIHQLNGRLCANSSFSGCGVIDSGFGDLTAEKQARRLHTPENDPEWIFIYLGTNDFARGVPVYKSRRDAYPMAYFYDSYREMLIRLHGMYPNACLFCGTIMRTTLRDRPDWTFPNAFGGTPLERYNEMIRRAAKWEKCILVDLEATGLRYETLDGVHPTAEGHKTIARAWLQGIRGLNNPASN